MENEEDNITLVTRIAMSLRDYKNLDTKCSCCKNTSYRSHIPLATFIAEALKKEESFA